MTYAETHTAYARVGYHGRTRDGRSVGRYEATDGLIMTVWDHSTNREQEPQLHSHVAVLNRARTRSDGKIRALDGRGFRPIKEAVATAYEHALEQLLTETLGVVFATRPDGKAREILGVDPTLCAEASTRRSQVLAELDHLIAEYVARHGRTPDAAARKALAQAATLATRAAKPARPARPPSWPGPNNVARRWPPPSTPWPPPPHSPPTPATPTPPNGRAHATGRRCWPRPWPTSKPPTRPGHSATWSPPSTATSPTPTSSTT
jgi:hypothetical protein